MQCKNKENLIIIGTYYMRMSTPATRDSSPIIYRKAFVMLPCPDTRYAKCLSVFLKELKKSICFNC